MLLATFVYAAQKFLKCTGTCSRAELTLDLCHMLHPVLEVAEGHCHFGLHSCECKCEHAIIETWHHTPDRQAMYTVLHYDFDFDSGETWTKTKRMPVMCVLILKWHDFNHKNLCCSMCINL